MYCCSFWWYITYVVVGGGLVWLWIFLSFFGLRLVRETFEGTVGDPCFRI